MKIAIVGGGVTGVVAAYRLLQRGHKVTIFEKNETVGGLLAGFKINGTNLEKAYHHIFTTDTSIIGLLEELELTDTLHWYSEKTAIYFEHKMYPFNGPKDLLMLGAMSLPDRIRTGIVGLWLQKDSNWEKYKPISAPKWMARWNGNKGYQVMWEPLLRGKFHQYYDQVSMAWLWARIHTRGNSNGKLGYLNGGWQQLIDTLVAKIKELGGEIKTKTLVDNYTDLYKKYDKVLNTGPIKGVTYLAAVEVVFASKQSLSHYYWGAYVPQNHRLMKLDEKTVKKEFFDYLKNIFPKFDKKLVSESFVFKMANAQHIVTTDFKIPEYKLSNELYQANFAQIFPEDRGTNFAVREGEKIAKLMAQE